MKRRILFVEDDPLLRQMYLLMLEQERDRWDVAAASNGPQALQAMQDAPFDVVVSDLNMPGMNGIELLTEVKARYPRTSRIILSGLDDQQRIARNLGTTHQFIAKPCDFKAFKATLSRVCGLDAYLEDEKLQALVGRLGSLPSFPTLYIEIMKELGSPDSSINRIAAIIGRDPGMTAKMLQIVNSVAFSLARKIGTPFEAVQFLGLGTVRSLVLSAHIFSCFERVSLTGFSTTRLWDHAMKTGMLARKIMQLESAEPAEAEDAYIAGMLHDAGKLMLAENLPGPFQQALGLAAERNLPLHEAELEVFGATHAGAAAYLLGLWGLPAPIVEAVAFHHTPQNSGLSEFGPLTAVHVANVLEPELAKAESCGRPAEIDLDYLAALGVRDRLEAWRAEAAKLFTAGA